MKKIYLFDKFPKLKQLKNELPVTLQFTQRNPSFQEDTGDIDYKLIEMKEFQTSAIEARGGHYKPISKLLKGLK